MTLTSKHLAYLVLFAVLAAVGVNGYRVYDHIAKDHASFHTMIRWINAADPLMKIVQDAQGAK